MVELDDDQRLVARTVREFVDREVIPVASGMEHRDEYPDQLVETMKSLGLFGLILRFVDLRVGRAMNHGVGLSFPKYSGSSLGISCIQDI